jgi:hypothetical protein
MPGSDTVAAIADLLKICAQKTAKAAPFVCGVAFAV